MASNEPSGTPDVRPARWWMFWRSIPLSLRRRRARLSDEADSDASSYWIRGGF